VAVSGAWLGLDPVTYAPSRLHAPDRTFPETNCYLDIWIEVLHALGIDPRSAMAFAVAVDFEGDQWTFFKPPPEDLAALYGIDVHEMQLYRGLAAHALEQLEHGRTMTVEVDAWYLPDTAGTSYRQGHVKTSIAIEAVDPANARLRYFHGPGYWELHGEDYDRIMRGPVAPGGLPPYAEIVRLDAGPCLEGDELRRAAGALLQRHLDRRPAANPWRMFGERLEADLELLLDGAEDDYHAYAFATVRQSGAAFECARDFVDWLAPDDPAGITAAEALSRQVAGAKALLFRLARRRAFDPAPAIEALAAAWEDAGDALQQIADAPGVADVGR
jgi:hypothetical protein